MKKIILSLIFIFSILVSGCSSCKQNGCFTGKKVKLRKGKKKSAGALVGVKGTSDEKSLKAQQKERKKIIQERRKTALKKQDSIDALTPDIPEIEEAIDIDPNKE